MRTGREKDIITRNDRVMKMRLEKATAQLAMALATPEGVEPPLLNDRLRGAERGTTPGDVLQPEEQKFVPAAQFVVNQLVEAVRIQTYLDNGGC